MKKILLFMMMALMLSSCSCSKPFGRSTSHDPDTLASKPEPEVRYVNVVDSSEIISLRAQLETANQQISLLQDSVKFYRDSTEYENYINARRIEKIKYYIKITENRSANKKYFFGWIRRTMDEN